MTHESLSDSSAVPRRIKIVHGFGGNRHFPAGFVCCEQCQECGLLFRCEDGNEGDQHVEILADVHSCTGFCSSLEVF